MQVRKEDLEKFLNEKEGKKEDLMDELFVTSKAILRMQQKHQTLKKKLAEVAEFDQYNLFKRKNIYNEDDTEFPTLPEENMIVATWINDLGNNHQEFDVS